MIRWEILILAIVLMEITYAVDLSSSNYSTDVILSSGGGSMNSSSYNTILEVGEPIVGNSSSVSYISKLGWLSNVAADYNPPIITLNTPLQFYSSTTSLVNFKFSVSDVNPYQCTLNFDYSEIKTINTPISGSYNISYDTGRSDGSAGWYISCVDQFNNKANSSIRSVNFILSSIAHSGGSMYYEDFYFVNLNEFETSYTHRDQHLPLPEAYVRFSVSINDPKGDEDVTFYYGFNKEEMIPQTMDYDEDKEEFYTSIGGYDPRTMIVYYVTAKRDGLEIRTPMQGYDVIIWDNPPVDGTGYSSLVSNLSDNIPGSSPLNILIICAIFYYFFFWKKEEKNKRELIIR